MNIDLKKHTILLAVGGSRAYGMDTPESDVDVKGVAVAPKECYLGFLNNFEQADKASHMMKFYDCLLPEEQQKADEGELEGTIYDVQKFFKLAAANNPNILDLLFCRDEDLRFITAEGKRIRENRDAFLSTKVKHTFSGYAISQLKRIKTHRKWLLDPPKQRPTRSEYGLPDDRKLLPLDQLQAIESVIRKKLDQWEIDFQDMDEAGKIFVQEQINNYLTEVTINQDDKYVAAARAVGLDDNLISFVLKERDYNAKVREWKQYNEWKKNRNPERAALEAKYGYDAKHASHLVRLFRTCREILEGGQVNIYRPDAAELLDIRNGAWSYDELADFAEREDKELNEVYKKSSLPRSPNRNKLDELCMEIIEGFYERD